MAVDHVLPKFIDVGEPERAVEAVKAHYVVTTLQVRLNGVAVRQLLASVASELSVLRVVDIIQVVAVWLVVVKVETAALN